MHQITGDIWNTDYYLVLPQQALYTQYFSPELCENKILMHITRVEFKPTTVAILEYYHWTTEIAR